MTYRPFSTAKFSLQGIYFVDRLRFFTTFLFAISTYGEEHCGPSWLPIVTLARLKLRVLFRISLKNKTPLVSSARFCVTVKSTVFFLLKQKSIDSCSSFSMVSLVGKHPCILHAGPRRSQRQSRNLAQECVHRVRNNICP